MQKIRPLVNKISKLHYICSYCLLCFQLFTIQNGKEMVNQWRVSVFWKSKCYSEKQMYTSALLGQIWQKFGGRFFRPRQILSAPSVFCDTASHTPTPNCERLTYGYGSKSKAQNRKHVPVPYCKYSTSTVLQIQYQYRTAYTVPVPYCKYSTSIVLHIQYQYRTAYTVPVPYCIYSTSTVLHIQYQYRTANTVPVSEVIPSKFSV
jgi:hypothetical protein